MNALSTRWNQFKTSAGNFWNDTIQTQFINGKIKPFYQKHQAVLSWQNAAIIISGVALAALALVAAAFLLPLEFMPFVALGSIGILAIAGLIAKKRLEGIYSKEAWPILSQLRQKIHESTVNDVQVNQIVPLLSQLDGKKHPKFSHLKHQIKELQKRIDELNRLLTTPDTQDQAIQSYKTALIQLTEELLRHCDSSQAMPALA